MRESHLDSDPIFEEIQLGKGNVLSILCIAVLK